MAGVKIGRAARFRWQRAEAALKMGKPNFAETVRDTVWYGSRGSLVILSCWDDQFSISSRRVLGMPVKKLSFLFVLTVCAAWAGGHLVADDAAKKTEPKKAEKTEEKKPENPLEEMDADTAKEYGGMIHGLFAKELKNPQVKFEGDVDKACGLVNLANREGIIAIPVKGFKEDRENKAVETDTGMGLCYLFLSQTFNPIVDGKPVDEKKLRVVKFSDADGNERKATCLLCSVKHVDGDDWQLYVYGSDKDPIIKAPFGEAGDAPKADLALTIQDPTPEKGQLVFNLFGKYAAAITVGLKHKDK
jgi:hypothetical protein